MHTMAPRVGVDIKSWANCIVTPPVEAIELLILTKNKNKTEVHLVPTKMECILHE